MASVCHDQDMQQRLQQYENTTQNAKQEPLLERVKPEEVPLSLHGRVCGVLNCDSPLNFQNQDVSNRPVKNMSTATLFLRTYYYMENNASRGTLLLTYSFMGLVGTSTKSPKLSDV